MECLFVGYKWGLFVYLVGIANALDLTDRILPRLQTRPMCRPQLLNFPPYTKDQLASILQERLKKVTSQRPDSKITELALSNL